jgi:RimJ/RimL family protein N-acetyltransferase
LSPAAVENQEIRIERATEKHKMHVLEMLSEHMPGADVVRRHAWLYEQNPHGRALTVVAYDSKTGEPLGLTSVFPRRIMVAGRMRMGSIGGDGYVRPVARRRGVATTMHRAVASYMRDEGVELMFGPPEPYNLRALERAGARVVTHVRRYARPHAVHGLLRRFSRLGSRNAVRLAPIEGCDKRVEEVWERSVDKTMVAPVRDAAHYAWRFAASPAGAQRAFAVLEGNRTAGVCVIERKEGRAAVVDMLAPADSFTRLLRAVSDACDEASLMTQLNEQGPAAAGLISAGFLPRESKPFQVFAASDVDPALFDAARWYYTWGDGDVDRVL